MNVLGKLILSAVSVVILAELLPGVTLERPVWDALLVAVVIAILNVLVKPLLILFTLPITILTLGLFLLFINAAIILLADKLISGFAVSSIWTALLFSICLSILQSVFNGLTKEEKQRSS